MNIKKLFAILAGVSMVANVALPGLAQAATPDNELGKAYEWAYSKGITTMDSFEKANMYGNITRAEMSKMLSVYAKTFLGKTADTSKECKFSDIDSVKGDLHDYIIESCQLGIMGQNITAFRPYDTLSRAEFGTALSRALWGDKNNTGTPYYAAHLNALKEAGIMNQINNADSTKEIRGYVMIMLQRASGEEDKDLCEMCLATGIGADKCEAVCGNNTSDDEDEVVKSGDLIIKATPSSNRRAVWTGVSDLDTITLKASEAITLNSVTLERYGYSDGDSVVSVWLENEKWTQITNPKSLSKDKVTLTLKKDYKELDSTDEFTIVVDLKNAKAGGTIGFKVIDADASAKNLDISNYDPYTYDIVDYAWATVILTQKWKDDNYNYAQGEKYEVQRFKAKADSSALTVNGFTLKDNGTVDLKDGIDKVEVLVNDEKVSNLDWSINSKEELKINFDEVEIAVRESAIFSVNITFVNGFDDLGNNIILSLAKEDFNAVEKKTGARVTVSDALAGNTYTIRGGKINLTNKKLGTVEASAETDDVVFWEWEIALWGEAIVLNPFRLTFQGSWTTDSQPVIKNVRIVVDGDETSASCTDSYGTTDKKAVTTVCDFTKSIDIDEDSKIQFLFDLTKYAKADSKVKVTPTSFGKATLKAGTTKANANIWIYDDANKPINDSDFIGTIDLNEVKVQTPKAALENSKSKTVEFTQGKSSTETIFEGKYTAKKKDVYLNSFKALSTATSSEEAKLAKYDELSMTLYINGDKVATTDVTTTGTNKVLWATEDFSKVLVKAGESVDVKVEVKAYANGAADAVEFTIYLSGEDADGNDAGTADDTAAQFKAVEKGSVSVNDSTYETAKDFRNNSVSLRKSNATIAKFDLKPSKSSSTVDLDTFTFTVKDVVASKFITDASKLRVKVGTDTNKTLSYDATNSVFVVSEIDETLEGDGITVEISTKWNPTASKYQVTLVNVNNGTDVNKVYNQYVLPVDVRFSQKDMGGSTKFTASMDAGDNDVEITKIQLCYSVPANAKSPTADECATQAITSISESTDWTVEIPVRAAHKDSAEMIEAVIITTNEKTTTPASCKVNGVDVINGTATLDSSTCTATLAATWDNTATTCMVNGVDVKAWTATLDSSTCTATLAATWTDATSTAYDPYVVDKATYNDYFRVDDTYLKVFKSN